MAPFVQGIRLTIHYYVKPFTSGCQILDVCSRRESITTAFYTFGVFFVLGVWVLRFFFEEATTQGNSKYDRAAL